MSTFELDEGAVAGVEELLRDTGNKVDDEARKASTAITSLGGSGWGGVASTVASSKQSNEFTNAAQRLHNIIDELAENLGVARNMTAGQEQDNEQALMAIDPSVGNFSRFV